MERRLIPAVFARGGTSKAVIFKAADLPEDRALWDGIFLHVLGSPDPYGRQLNGLGGGLSSLSKVVVVAPSERADADVDYTFVQVAVREAVADHGAMCGNMSAAVGPFAVDEGLVRAGEGQTLVRVYNTNTGKLFHAAFPVRGGRAVEEGDFTIPGVAGSGAMIRLEYLSPGGAVTGRLLPTTRPADRLSVEGLGEVAASLVDSSNPVVFVRAADLGRTATESPEELDADAALMARLERIRRAGSVAMGLSRTQAEAGLSNPKVAMIGPPAPFTALDGRRYGAQAYHVAMRIVSVGNIHRAAPLTGAMCLAVAAQIPGSIAAPLAPPEGPLLIGTPSGVLPVEAEVRVSGGRAEAVSATTFRTQRRLMEGAVPVPAALLGPDPTARSS